MTEPRFTPAADESAVRDPDLQALVDRARPPAPSHVGVEFQSIRSGVEARRSSRRGGLLLTVVGATAAAAALAWFSGGRAIPPQPATEIAVSDPIGPGGTDRFERVRTPTQPPVPQPVALGEGITLEPAVPEAVHRVMETRFFEIKTGAYRVSLAPKVEPVRVLLNDRVLELASGTALVGVDGVTLLEGSAAWIGADGTRQAVSVESGEPRKRSSRNSAVALSRRAESRLQAGDRAGAIALLEQIAARHPRSSAARSALMDLGRLYKASGQRARARCAYDIYLERWPSTPLRPDIERARKGLGDGPVTCGSLRR